MTDNTTKSSDSGGGTTSKIERGTRRKKCKLNISAQNIPANIKNFQLN